MHVMDGDCEKTTECLAAEGAPVLVHRDKNGGDVIPDCKDSLLEDSKSFTEQHELNNPLPLNGEHTMSPQGSPKQDSEGGKSSLKESESDAELLPEDAEISQDKKLNSAEEVDNSEAISESTEKEVVDDNCQNEKEAEPLEDLDKAEDLSKVSEKNESLEGEKDARESVEKQTKEEKEETAIGSEEEDRQSVSSSHLSQNETERRKRSVEREAEAEGSSGSESEGGRKRLKQETENTTPEISEDAQSIFEDERERAIREFVDGCTQNTDDLSHTIEKLQKELATLAELIRAKELEWNSLLRLRKLKEEMLERVLRKKRQTLFENSNMEWIPEAINQRNSKSHCGNNQLMMVPIVSSSPGSCSMSGHGVSAVPPVRIPELGRQQRPILPKPYPQIIDPAVIREGRNGPILDVKSIIADYSSPFRSRHPESVPRRGRRVRSEMPVVPRIPASPALISMANMALGSGSSVRTAPIPPYALGHDPCQVPDSVRCTQGENNNGMSFKDVLVQFAKLSQGPSPGKPPPPYPEVTLHPVVSSPQSPPTSHSSLLHGILTKSTSSPSPAHRPTTFSPTLARLLTAPERPIPSHQLPQPQMPPQFRPPASRLSITDILSSSKKARNEITITPVAGHQGTKSKDDVVLLDDDDETGSGDRLVIDEGGDAGSSDDIPQCQGCRQKPAQFVCAGCGNQWYCSRECQVTAWEEHSDNCSG